MRDALAADGFSPIVTGEPRELVDLLRTHRPQLVLLDLMLPGADGIGLLEQVPELANRPGPLPLRLRPGRDARESVGARSHRLHRQALLADGADGESPGGPAPGGRSPNPSCWTTS